MTLTIHTHEFNEITRRLDKIAELQKQILLVVQARQLKPRKKSPHRHRRQWYPDEDQEVRALYEDKVSIPIIAARLDRSERSVENRIRKLLLSRFEGQQDG